MKSTSILNAQNPDLAASMPAMKRAAAQARQIAIKTGTAIIVRRGQQIVRRSAEELSMEESSASHGR